MNLRDTDLFASPQWTLFIDGGRLFASAGADEMYLIDSLDGAEAQDFLEAYRSGALERISAENAAFAPVIAQLLETGALFRGLREPSPRLPLAVRWCGDPLAAFQASLLEEPGSDGWTWTTGDGAAGLGLVVRTNGSLAQAVESAADLRIPHLLVDLSSQHTLSLGPLVKPGQTACLSCLAGRITRLWADHPIPTRPAMLERHRLAASLTALQAQKFQRYGTCPELIERLWCMDLNSMSSRFDALHRLPWCPQCFPGKAGVDSGRLALPWA